MKKRVLLVLITLFLGELNFVYSQSRESYLEGPDEVLQYCTGTYTYHYWPQNNTPGVSILPVWIIMWGVEVVDEKSFIDSEGMHAMQKTLLYTTNYADNRDASMDVTVSGITKTVVVKKNPLLISIPNHICPYGTQIIFPEVDHRIGKTITITGDRTAQITDMGLLTYDPETIGEIDLEYKLGVAGDATIHKKIRLEPDYKYLQGMYDVEINNSIRRVRLSEDKNYANNGKAVELCLNSDILNFSWELLTGTGAFEISYDKNSKIFRFIPSYQVGHEVRFRFSFNRNINCTHMNVCDYGFTIRNPYSVSYINSSNVIQISRENDFVILNRMSTQIDAYRIIDALSGTLKKQGQLVQDINEINATDIPNGVYVVQIISGDEQESYKISIAR